MERALALAVVLAWLGGCALAAPQAGRGEPAARAAWPQLVVQSGHHSVMADLAFSPDGRSLVSGNQDGTVKIWDLATGRELRTFVGHRGLVWRIAVSRDGRRIASASTDHTTRLWDVESGRTLHTWQHAGPVWSVALSPDGTVVAAGDATGAIRLWDAATGAARRTIREPTEVNRLVFLNDGAWLAAGAGHVVTIWNPATGEKVRALAPHADHILSLTVSRDGRWLASGTLDGEIRVWDTAGGWAPRTVAPRIGPSHGVYSLAFSPEGRILAGQTIDGLRLWETAGWSALPTPSDMTSARESMPLAFSPDGRWLAAAAQASLKIWETQGWRQQVLLGSVAMHPNGRLIASGATRIRNGSEVDTTVRLWSAQDGRLAHELVGHTDGVPVVTFSPDGALLASASWDKTVRLWDTAAGRPLRTLAGHTGQVDAVAFSPDGRWLASASGGITFPERGGGRTDDTIRLWDVATGGLARSWRAAGSGGSLAFSPDGRWLAITTWVIELWDVERGRRVRTLRPPRGASHARFSPDGRWLFAGCGDGATCVFAAETGETLATLVPLSTGADWLVVAPDGLFDGSPRGWKRILWRFGGGTRDVAPVEVFFREYYHPGLLAEILAGKRPRAARDITGLDRRRARLALAVDGAPSAREVRVRVTVAEAPAGARDVRLFRDGSLVKIWRGDVLKGGAGVILEAPVAIVAGEQRLTAYAFNHDDIKSDDAEATVTGAEGLRRRGLAHVLAVGINRYGNRDFNLRYAVSDARAFAETLRREQAKLGVYGEVRVIPLEDEGATKRGLVEALARLAAAAQPEDAVFVYFAGHGIAAGRHFTCCRTTSATAAGATRWTRPRSRPSPRTGSRRSSSAPPSRPWTPAG